MILLSANHYFVLVHSNKNSFLLEGDYLILTQDCRKVKTNESSFVTPPPSNVPGEWDIKAKALKQKPCNDQVTHHNSPISVESWKSIHSENAEPTFAFQHECNGSDLEPWSVLWYYSCQPDFTIHNWLESRAFTTTKCVPCIPIFHNPFWWTVDNTPPLKQHFIPLPKLTFTT